jgi:hypothetical protein
MALCPRCGQQMADSTEFCSICGSHSATDGPGESAAVRALTGTADYLRPFAAEEPAYPALSDHAPLAPSAAHAAQAAPATHAAQAAPATHAAQATQAAPAAQHPAAQHPAAQHPAAQHPAFGGYSSPSGYLPEYLPPPYGPAEPRRPQDDYLPAPEATRTPGQPYRLRGPFTPPPRRDDALTAEPGASLAEPGLPPGYAAQNWREYAYPAQLERAGQAAPFAPSRPAGEAAFLAQAAHSGQAAFLGQPASYAEPAPADPAAFLGQPASYAEPAPADPAAFLGQPASYAPPASYAEPAPGVQPWSAGQPLPVGERRPAGQPTAGSQTADGTGAMPAPHPSRRHWIPTSAVRTAGEPRPDDESHTATLPAVGLRKRALGPLGGRWISAGVAAGVVIIAVVAAIVLVGHGGPTAGTGRGRSAQSAGGATRQPAPTAPATTGPLAVTSAAAAGPDAKAVARFVIRYFRAINQHDFATYRSLFSVSLRGGLSSAAFTRGYGSSRDSLATLRAISPVGASELDAAVSFTSHQQPADTPSRSACTTWNISLYLVRQGHSGYVIVSPPAGYRASFAACS